MIEFRNQEIPPALGKIIQGDFLFKMTHLLKDNPGFLSEILLKLDRTMDEPEDSRVDRVKDIFASIERDMPQNNNKIMLI